MSTFGAIDCGAESACKDAQFAFINNSPHPITIEQLKCDEEDSCHGATFSFVGGFVVEGCDCGLEGGCDGVVGVDLCVPIDSNHIDRRGRRATSGMFRFL